MKSRDQYLGELTKGNVDVAPEYTGGIVDLLNTLENGADAEPLTTPDAQESIDAAQSLLEKNNSRCSTRPRRRTPTPSS